MNTLNQNDKYKLGSAVNRILYDCERTLKSFVNKNYNISQLGPEQTKQTISEFLFVDSYAYKMINITTPRNLWLFISEHYKMTALEYLKTFPSKFIRVIKNIVGQYPAMNDVLSENETFGDDSSEAFLAVFYSFVCNKYRDNIYESICSFVLTNNFKCVLPKLSEGPYGLPENIIYDIYSLYHYDECPICYDVMTRSTTEELSCSHCFHIKCVQRIKDSHLTHTCPLCRVPL
jgi:hypothetical protein